MDVRALVVTNMFPTPARPMLGRFVSDQIEALRGIDGLDLEVFAFTGGSPAAYRNAAGALRRRFRATRFDVVHAHFGLTAWPAMAVPARAHGVTLHGTDLAHPRSRAITIAGLRRLELVGVVSAELAGRVPGWATRDPVQVLPCGVDLSRFAPIERAVARAALGLRAEGPYLLFGADPARREKRFDLARSVAGDVPLLTLGAIDPETVPLYVNAANAVLVPSDREGFGLAALEALACDVPVLATPHGVAPEALTGVDGTLCADFSVASWRPLVARHVADPDPRVRGRERAQAFSAEAMARRLLTAWQEVL